MTRAAFGWAIAVLLAATIALTSTVPGAMAADQAVTLFASNVDWHVGSASAPRNPTITVVVGDTLRLTIPNADNFDHTFTVTHFAVNRPLAASVTIFVNITTSTADLGTWQFYCAIPGHAPGSEGSRTGMVGNIVVVSSTPPPPALDPLLLGALLLVVVVVVAGVAVAMRRRKKAP